MTTPNPVAEGSAERPRLDVAEAALRDEVKRSTRLCHERGNLRIANREHIDRIDVLEAELARTAAALGNALSYEARAIAAELRAEDAEAEALSLRRRVEALAAAADASEPPEAFDV